MAQVYKDIIRLTIDLKTGVKEAITPIKQADNLSRVLRCQLINNGKPINLKGSQLLLYVVKADYKQCVINGVINESKTGIVDFELTEQSLILAEEIQCEIVKIDEGDILLSFPIFKIGIDGALYDNELVESTNEFSALTALISNVASWENRFVKECERIEEKFDGKIDEVNTQLSHVRLLNTPIMLKDLHTDVKEAMTGGSVAVVGKESVGYENLKKQSVFADNVEFVEVCSSNLFNKLAIEDGCLSANGNIEPMTNVVTSDFIKIKPLTKYSSTGFGYKALYNESLEFIGNLFTENTFTTSEDSCYIKLSIALNNLNTAMFVEGSTVPAYEDYYSNIVLKENVKIKKSNLDDVKFSQNDLTFAKVYSINLLDLTKITDNAYVNNGNVYQLDGYACTDYIEVIPLETYRHNGGVGFYDIYDENKIKINENDAGGSVFEIPENGKYLRCSFYKETKPLNEIMLVKGELPSTYIPYKEEYELIDITIDASNVEGLTNYTSRLYGKKWAIIGDSISDQNYKPNFKLYYNFIHERTNVEIYPHGISATSIAIRDGYSNSMLERVDSLEDELDIITVFGGTNDFGLNVPLGTFESTDTTTFYGALRALCEKLIKKYQGKTIAFFTPIQRSHQITTPERREQLETYVAAVKEVTGYYSIPCLDLYYRGGLTPIIDDIRLNYFEDQDGLHPNYAGHEFLSYKIEKFLESL